MAKYALDLFGVLRMLDKQNMNIHDSLRDNPDALKELEKNAGWMLPMWMTASQSEGEHKQLIRNFEQKANGVWESTYGNPILQLRLLAACGTGRTSRHKFYKKDNTKYGELVLNLLREITPDIRQDEVEMWVRNNDEHSTEELARLCGYQEKEIKALLTEFRRVKK